MAHGAVGQTPWMRMLTGFAQVLHQHPQRDRFIKPLADAQLQQFGLRRLVQMLTAERHRLRLAHAPPVPAFRGTLPSWADDCDGRLQQHHAELAQVLSSVPGVGAHGGVAGRAAGLGRLDRRRIAALEGAAPMDSGMRGHAPSWAGEPTCDGLLPVPLIYNSVEAASDRKHGGHACELTVLNSRLHVGISRLDRPSGAPLRTGKAGSVRQINTQCCGCVSFSRVSRRRA